MPPSQAPVPECDVLVVDDQAFHRDMVTEMLIDRALGTQYDLDPAEARLLRAEAEIDEEGAPDTVRFTRLIKDAVPYEERSGVVEALWRIAAADGINADEHGLMRLVANLLGVTD